MDGGDRAPAGAPSGLSVAALPRDAQELLRSFARLVDADIVGVTA